jgi:hypothetical protein
MYGHDHPPPLGSHPWLDPFAPQDIFNPRPDQELALAGAMALQPQDFRFTDAGRRDYYAAVRTAAQQQAMMQHQHMKEMQALHAARVQEEQARAAKRRLQANLLLLTP